SSTRVLTLNERMMQPCSTLVEPNSAARAGWPTMSESPSAAAAISDVFMLEPLGSFARLTRNLIEVASRPQRLTARSRLPLVVVGLRDRGLLQRARIPEASASPRAPAVRLLRSGFSLRSRCIWDGHRQF